VTDDVSLVVENINVLYGNVQVLWDVSLDVKKGEIVSLIGANGAGKSTILKSIIGLVKPKSGKIIFEGKSLLGQRIHSRVRSGVGYVPEGRRLFYAMTVEENLRMGRRGNKSDNDGGFLELEEKVFGLFPVLRERAKQYAGNLSGGEQQMLAIARALMSNPKILLLDELSFGLAPALFEKVLESILEINKSGISVLLAEQNAEKALEASGRTYVIENGRITLEGKSEDLLDRSEIREAYLGVVQKV
jgi:branched-chain amino acid transport system ATP-binding protein